MATASQLQFTNLPVLKHNLETLVSVKGGVRQISAHRIVGCNGYLYNMNCSHNFPLQCVLAVSHLNKVVNLQRVVDTLRFTGEIFARNMSVIENALAMWEEYVSHVAEYDVRAIAANESETVDQRRSRLREVACVWDKTVGPYLHLQKEGRGFQDFHLKVSPECVQRWQGFADLCKIEWICDCEVPMRALTRVLIWFEGDAGKRGRREYDPISKSAIQKFCQVLNSRNEHCAVTKGIKLQTILFNAMQGLVRAVNRQHQSRPDYAQIVIGELSHLLLLLKSEGCTVLDQPDSSFLVWRGGVVQSAQFKEGCITIVERLGKTLESEEVIYYRYKESSDHVVAIFNNPIVAPIRANERVQHCKMHVHENFVVSNVTGMDEEFRYVVFERVESFSAVPITTARIQLFSSVVKGMLRRGVSFDLMDPKYWGFVKSSEKIACIKPVQLIQKVDVLGWEKLIRAFSGNSEDIFNQVMRDSGLMQTKEAACYCQAVRAGLLGAELGDEALKEAQVFYINARVLYDATVQAWNGKVDKDKVGKVLVQVYQDLSCITYPEKRLLELAEEEFQRPQPVSPSGMRAFLSSLSGGLL